MLEAALCRLQAAPVIGKYSIVGSGPWFLAQDGSSSTAPPPPFPLIQHET
jgi:hypothetical protein